MNAGAEHPDAVLALSEFSTKLRFEDIPAGLVGITKQAVLDTLGVALAASGIGDGCREIVEYATAQGGRPEATIWSSGIRVPAATAALANAALARALDYDDLTDTPLIHVSVCIVPAAFAIAERRKTPVSGKDFLTALVVGSEVHCRLADAAAKRQSRNEFPAMLATQIFGYFGAAAAAGRLLELMPAKMQSAFGIALMQAAGTEEMIVHSSESVGKFIYSAFSNQGGVQSALLADCGALAHGAILEGRAGLFAAYYGGKYDRAVMTEGLGERFLASRRCFKFWPGTWITHPFVEAALELMQKNALRHEDIAAVNARVGAWGKAMSEPLDMRRHPPTASAAMNSMPFIISKVLVNGTVRLEDFNAHQRKQPEVMAMADKYLYTYDPQLDGLPDGEPGLLEVRTKEGRSYSARVDHPRGHPARPLSFADTAHKFRETAKYTPAVPEPARIEQIIEQVGRLDELEDVRELVAILVR